MTVSIPFQESTQPRPPARSTRIYRHRRPGPPDHRRGHHRPCRTIGSAGAAARPAGVVIFGSGGYGLRLTHTTERVRATEPSPLAREREFRTQLPAWPGRGSRARNAPLGSAHLASADDSLLSMDRPGAALLLSVRSEVDWTETFPDGVSAGLRPLSRGVLFSDYKSHHPLDELPPVTRHYANRALDLT